MPVANPASPVASCNVDPVTGAVGGGATYTGISTNGTTVVKAAPGLFLGLTILAAGASSNTLVVYDGTASSANVVLGTYTNIAVGSYAPNPWGVGVRCLTGITIVSTTGTAAVGNVLWD